MYKKRFEKWKWKKNRKFKGVRPAQNLESDRDSDVLVVFGGTRDICDTNVRDKWCLDDVYHTKEDEWDDTFGQVLCFIEGTVAAKTSSKALPQVTTLREYIKPMVEALGFFSYPTILTLAFRMCSRLKAQGLVKRTVGDFLLECQKCSEEAGSSRHTPLTRVLQHAYSFSQRDPDAFDQLIVLALSQYLDQVRRHADPESVTALSLESLYLVYVKTEDDRLQKALESLGELLDKSERDNGSGDDATLDILALTIFMLQRTDNELELVKQCVDMIGRIERRHGSAEGPMEDKLRGYYLDSFHVLAKLEQKTHTAKANRVAVRHMEKYMDILERCNREQDGYDKILEDRLNEVQERLGAASLTEP
jgi:hypothetical protein